MGVAKIRKEIIILKNKISDIRKQEISEENTLELETLEKALDILISNYAFMDE